MGRLSTTECTYLPTYLLRHGNLVGCSAEGMESCRMKHNKTVEACHKLVFGCIWKAHFPCLALKTQIVFPYSPLQSILLASTGHRQQQEDEDLDEYQAGPTGWSSNTGSHA